MKIDLDLSREEINSAIDSYIHNQRDREMLKRRLTDGVIFDDLADEFGLSVRHTKRIIYKAQDKLFRHLERGEKNDCAGTDMGCDNSGNWSYPDNIEYCG
jgi:AraC-like DNA-binding protein